MRSRRPETDAMKRALTTFGNPFGLALYDKEQQNVRGRRGKQGHNGNGQAISWIVLSAEGEYISAHEDPVDYCKALRQLLEAASTRERLRALWQRNLVTLAMLRRNLPELKSEPGEHYADILTALYKRCLRELHEAGQAEPKQRKGNGATGQIDKSALAINAPRRLRDKDHLRHVASQPCLVCGRSPSQAHHLRFAQPRALGRKVSDEWVVPLCATHHRALHDTGNEECWWKERDLDPIAHARVLWRQSRNGNSAVFGEKVELKSS